MLISNSDKTPFSILKVGINLFIALFLMISKI